VIAPPVVPVDPVAKALVLAPQVEAVEVGVVAGTVPPGTLEPGCTVVPPGVVVVVLCAELGPLLGETLPELPVHACVDDPELVELCPDDEVVDSHLRRVPVPVLHVYQQLLGLCEGDVVPVL